MSCIDCEEVKDIAYYRVDKANVGLIGCDQHLNKIMRMIDGMVEDRIIYRVKSEKDADK